MKPLTTQVWLKLRICVGSRKSRRRPAMSNNLERTTLSPTFPANPALPNYFGNSKSNAFNDILAFDLLRTIASRGSG